MRRISIDSRPVVTRSLAAALFIGAGFLLGASAATAGEEIPDPGPGDGGTVVLGEDHAWRFFRGTQDPPAEWNSPGFDDSSWEQGPTGIGYGDGDDRTVLEDMRCSTVKEPGVEGEGCTGGGYLAFFARTGFESPVIPEGQRLFFRVSYDDGVVLYVNGVQVGRVNMPDGPVTSQTRARSAIGDAPASPDWVVVIPAELLRDGGNVLAASVHNVQLTSTDVSFVPRLILGPEREPDPEPTCKDRCAARASEAFQACLAEGLGEDACRAKKSAVYAECLEAECDQPPHEPTCAERCAARASEAFQACLADGLGEDACRAKKSAVYAECLEAEGCDVQPPGEPTCAERCEEAAAKTFRMCREEGGTEEACRERSLAAQRECVAACEEKPPAERPCAEECAASGNAVYLACLEAGGGKDECRRRADGIVALCLERCGAGTPCEDGCAVAAQIVLTGCGLAHLPEEDCRAMANSVLERCVGTCEPAPSCESGCQELAARAVAECRGREGSEEECAAKGAAVLAECVAHCEGEPVPDCDRQCEGKADELFKDCLSGGRTEAECKADREAFLAGCQAELGEVCQKEQEALRSAFQLFERGDSNRDGQVDLSDSVAILGNLFLGDAALPCEDAADANDDGAINIADPVTLLNSLFLGAGAIPAPTGGKGQDPTSDRLLCAF